MRWIWFDRVVEFAPRERLVTVKNVSLAEEHLRDHFEEAQGRPAVPIMPASLIIEGVAQTTGVLVGHAEGFREKVILAKISRATLDREAVPGMTLRYTATITQSTPLGASATGIIDAMDHTRPEDAYQPFGKVDLVFSHIDQNMGGTRFPEHNFVFNPKFHEILQTMGIADK